MKIFVAGHRGMVGNALVRILKKNPINEIITKTKSELNLLDQKAVHSFFKKNKIDQVYLAAAKVGGIHANNTYPADFIAENLLIQSNIISSAHLSAWLGCGLSNNVLSVLPFNFSTTSSTQT